MGTVHRIEPCPPIAEGEGSVVTGRIITRQTAGLVRVEFTGGEPLIGTDIHPVWSLDRQDWVGLGDLQPLERVAAEDGETIVLSVTPLAELAQVFNLEIHGEHVYQVTSLGVLVHNADVCNETVRRVLAKIGLYPSAIDPRTGRKIAFPSGIQGIVDKSVRVTWDTKDRAAFIANWRRRGYDVPRGGWDKYDIHHIQPREFGGTNDFWNLVPVERKTHQLFNDFWREFTGL